MDAIQTPPPPPPPTSPSYYNRPSSGVFGTKIPGNVAFILGLLLFFLPFAQIKCGGTVFASNTGLGLAIGSQWKVSMMDNGLFGNKGTDATDSKISEKKQDPNLYAIVAMGLALIGVMLSFANGKSTAFGGLITGILSAAALIGLMIDLKNSPSLKELSQKPKSDTAGLDYFGDVKVGLEFTPWFYVAIIVLIVAGIFCYLRGQAAKR